jgi:molybdopterin-guanine dinucleotide biosynthesis protein A
MGRDKALIEVGEQPLLARQINLAWATRATEVFISGRTGVDYSHFNCPVLLDRLPGAGPLAGIERGLAALTNVRLLVLAVDLPEMTETLLTAMAEASPEHFGAIPRWCASQSVASEKGRWARHQVIRLLTADNRSAFRVPAIKRAFV